MSRIARFNKLTRKWLAAGRFDDLADLLGAVSSLRLSRGHWFAHGRTLALAGKLREAERYLGRANRGGRWFFWQCTRRSRRRRAACRLMLQCLRGETIHSSTVGPSDLGGRDFEDADWLAVATILADRGHIDLSLDILNDRVSVTSMPLSILERVAFWTDKSPRAGDTLLSLAADFPFNGDHTALLELLRALLARQVHPTLEKLLELAPQIVPTPLTHALSRVGRELSQLPAFATIPMIGETLVEVKRVQMMRKLEILLGTDPIGAADPAARLIRLVPISDAARAEWASLNASAGEI